MENYKPGSFGCHELLDRLSLALEFVDERVLDHPACQLDPEWVKKATAARDMLFGLYQEVGAKHLDAPPEPQKAEKA